jgi:hypothetical protein
MSETFASSRPGGGASSRPMAEGAESRASAHWTAGRLALLLVLWIVAHPYFGIVHDARYYALQALQASNAGDYAGDLFFKYGSQDRYTVFTALYAPLVGWLGPGQAHLLAYVVGQLFWFGALVWLLRVLFEPPVALLAALGAVLLNPHYGSASIFQYGEVFVTPRLYSEALALCALALLHRRRVVASGACLFAAGLLHPLMAIPGAVVFAIGVGKRMWSGTPPARRWTSLAAAAAAVAALAIVALIGGLMPRATTVFDPAWFELVLARSAYAFLARWSAADWFQVLATAAALLTAVAVLARQRPSFVAVFVAAAGCTAFGFLAGDLGRDVLAVNLQLWRSLWLATLFANIALGALIAQSERGALSKELLWGALLVGFAAHFAPLNPFVQAIPVFIGLGVFWWERRTGRSLPAIARLAAGVAVALCLGWAVLLAAISSLLDGWAWVPQALAGAAALVLLSAPLPRLEGPKLRLAAGAALAVLALATADFRSDWQKFTEAPGLPADLRPIAQTPGGVYWESDPTFVWVKLRRADFYACEQGTGAMFYRGTAMEFAAKSAVMRQLDTADFGDNSQLFCPAKADPKAFAPTASAIRQVCRAYPDLDLLVLNEPAPDLSTRTWRSPAPKEVMTASGRRKIDRFYVYACGGLR